MTAVVVDGRRVVVVAVVVVVVVVDFDDSSKFLVCQLGVVDLSLISVLVTLDPFGF